MGFSSTNRKRYTALKAAGVCVRCSAEKAREGRTECDQCSNERNQIRMRRYVKNKSEDLCNACRKNKPAPGMKMCASCRILAAAAARKRAAAKESK